MTSESSSVLFYREKLSNSVETCLKKYKGALLKRIAKAAVLIPLGAKTQASM